MGCSVWGLLGVRVVGFGVSDFRAEPEAWRKVEGERS